MNHLNQINYRSIRNLNHHITSNLHKIPNDTDLIVGIPRSGLFAANLIALHLNLPLLDFNGFINNQAPYGGRRCASLLKPIDQYTNILIVDDSLLTGKSMEKAKERVNSLNLMIRVKFAAIYVVPEYKDKVDIYFDICLFPRVFEWNIMHHDFLDLCLVDIDGVLCIDPTEEQNDDGEKYLDFIDNALPLFRPTQKIGCLVTNRLEKYRSETESWLKKHRIIYDELIMLNLPDSATRRKLGIHAKFKAAIYKSSNALLFIESSEWQAREIAVLANKPVYCADLSDMIYP